MKKFFLSEYWFYKKFKYYKTIIILFYCTDKFKFYINSLIRFINSLEQYNYIIFKKKRTIK